MPWRFVILIALTLSAAAAPPTTQRVTNKLPHIQVDVKNRVVRVECESCNAHQDVGLEFFCVVANTNEYESVLRTEAKPSDVHLALLMIGLVPGQPVKYSEETKKWTPPTGPALSITCEWTDKDNKPHTVPAWRLMRDNKTKKESAPITWVFTGSKVMEDGKYGADPTGYVVSVLNSELAVIDVSTLAATALETRELDRNEDLLPEAGRKIWMVIEPAARAEVGETIVAIDKAGKVTVDGIPVAVERVADVLTNRRVASPVKLQVAENAPPQTVSAVRKAIDSANPTKSKQQLIESLRQQKQHFLDEADRIQKMIDALEKE